MYVSVDTCIVSIVLVSWKTLQVFRVFGLFGSSFAIMTYPKGPSIIMVYT